MKAIFDALNVVYDEDEKRSFIKLNLISLSFTLGAIVVLLLAIGAVVVLPLVLAYLGFAAEQQAGLSAAAALAGAVRAGDARSRGALSLRPVAAARQVALGQRRQRVRRAHLARGLAGCSPGTCRNFADYNATYGSLGAVIGLMMWMWLSTIVILVGAELNSEIEHQTAQRLDRRARPSRWARAAPSWPTRSARRRVEI